MKLNEYDEMQVESFCHDNNNSIGYMELTEVIDDVDDITDPFSMEKILMFVDYIQTQDDDFIKLLMEKLVYLDITWEQPWYQQQMSLTRPVAVNNKAQDMFRTDKISKEESDHIHKNWRKFRKRYDIPNTPQCFARWRNTNKSRNPNTREECVRRYVTAFLAQGLERTLHQVYKHILTHYGAPNKGPYTMQEEKLMEVCFYHNPRNAVPILSTVLGREPRGIYKKLHEQAMGPREKKRIIWKLPIATKFLNLLIEYTGLPLEELKYRRFEKSVWLKLENDMDQQYIYLQKFWYDKLHVQLFVKKEIKLRKIRKRIARKLQKFPYKVWSDIRWKELLKEFPDGFTHGFLYKAWASLFRNHKEILKVSLQELIEYALQRIPTVQNRRLRTLAFNEERELTEIRYDKVTTED